MTSLKEKIDLEELISILIGMCLSGTILMWLFYTTFPDHTANLFYLILAILFTVATPALFVLLWFRKKKA